MALDHEQGDPILNPTEAPNPLDHHGYVGQIMSEPSGGPAGSPYGGNPMATIAAGGIRATGGRLDSVMYRSVDGPGTASAINGPLVGAENVLQRTPEYKKSGTAATRPITLVPASVAAFRAEHAVPGTHVRTVVPSATPTSARYDINLVTRPANSKTFKETPENMARTKPSVDAKY